MTTIVQVNIQLWNKNKYLLQCEFSNLNPDIILINEVGIPSHQIVKMSTYNTISNAIDLYSGAAILIKKGIRFENIELKNPNILAIKIQTNMGPIIISTAYIAPRNLVIPTIEITKILSYKLPTLFIADFNAHHPLFNNTTAGRKYGDNKGKTLAALAHRRNLICLGPTFDTFKTNRAKGKPDIILCNNLFNIFHHQVTRGNHVGSDHFPIIFKIAIKPFRVLCEPKLNIRSLNIDGFRKELEPFRTDTLHNKPINEIDKLTEKIINNITEATVNNCKITK